MTRLKILVEGQTEETFVRELLVPHYARMGLYISPIVATTSPSHRGGIVSYGKVRNQLVRLCREDRDAWISTFFDLYALPGDFPGKLDRDYPHQGSGGQKAAYLEGRLTQDLDERNFIPYLMVHEFEALLFVEPQRFGDWTDDAGVAAQLTSQALKFSSPEEINEGVHSAPSKRITQAMPGYQKPTHGPLIACDIGLDPLRQSCPHFSAWLNQIEQLGSN
ncbi:MAG: hypothetical protein COX57_08630 [Alphaproteobacteria bacterium CG_4_10_14_0_2_um_filter_63_37]|nr:MAG: hypothetical protein AUJ55_12250 [Proteobacteria bacterium CG1_02_64_396]PJA24417.1 MAG: hypothetical protein COX57_08630 [Alphaproteobacteria bacterium CG_4_10_14_0_2_um_filter_63_37]